MATEMAPVGRGCRTRSYSRHHHRLLARQRHEFLFDGQEHVASNWRWLRRRSVEAPVAREVTMGFLRETVDDGL
jgi:hypothetical protein